MRMSPGARTSKSSLGDPHRLLRAYCAGAEGLGEDAALDVGREVREHRYPESPTVVGAPPTN
jgi:hypothetical protein